MDEMNYALQVAFYYYYTIFGFGSVYLLTG